MMKLLKLYYVFLFVILLIKITNGQSALNAQGMAPLNQNNLWVYDNFTHHSIWTCRDELVTIDTFQYNVIIFSPIGPPQYIRLREEGYYVLRRDSSYSELNHEEIYYKKDAELGESWTQLMYGSNIYTYTSVVTDTFPLQIFNTLVTGKVVRKDLGLVLLDELWTEEFGIISTVDYTGVMDYLVGCVIDRVVYGDTSTTSVEYESLGILPEKIELLQNYPNPFNPVTTISYNLSERSYISLKVFDVLGNEITTLEEGEKVVGRHTVQWNGKDKFQREVNSGVYFIHLAAPFYNNTIKGVMLK